MIKKEKTNTINCTLCNIKITQPNWARHARLLKHLKNDPDQTIPLKKRGKPKTKPDPTIPKVDRRRRETKPDPKPSIPKVDRRRRDVTRKSLLSQAKDYNLTGCTRLSKEQLLSVLSKAKKLLFKKDDLHQLTKTQLANVAKENNIKVNLRKKKDEIIGTILKTQDSVFREIAAFELSFHDDLIEPIKEERKPAYTIRETLTRHIRKFNATETDFAIKVNKVMETENAINRSCEERRQVQKR
jgi:hypothetical protein